MLPPLLLTVKVPPLLLPTEMAPRTALPVPPLLVLTEIVAAFAAVFVVVMVAAACLREIGGAGLAPSVPAVSLMVMAPLPALMLALSAMAPAAAMMMLPATVEIAAGECHGSVGMPLSAKLDIARTSGRRAEVKLTEPLACDR